MPLSEQSASTLAAFTIMRRNRIISPDKKIEKQERKLHLGKKEEGQSGSIKWKKLYAKRCVPRRRERACKENFPRRKHERVSRHKSSLGESGEYWFHSTSNQI